MLLGFNIAVDSAAQPEDDGWQGKANESGPVECPNAQQKCYQIVLSRYFYPGVFKLQLVVVHDIFDTEQQQR